MKVKCKVCGCEFSPTKERRYTSRDEMEHGLGTAFGKTSEVAIYDTFDCIDCGCQIIVQQRKRSIDKVGTVTLPVKKESDGDENE